VGRQHGSGHRGAYAVRSNEKSAVDMGSIAELDNDTLIRFIHLVRNQFFVEGDFVGYPGHQDSPKDSTINGCAGLQPLAAGKATSSAALSDEAIDRVEVCLTDGCNSCRPLEKLVDVFWERGLECFVAVGLDL
jgi:hypothetical protein